MAEILGLFLRQPVRDTRTCQVCIFIYILFYFLPVTNIIIIIIIFNAQL